MENGQRQQCTISRSLAEQMGRSFLGTQRSTELSGSSRFVWRKQHGGREKRQQQSSTAGVGGHRHCSVRGGPQSLDSRVGRGGKSRGCPRSSLDAAIGAVNQPSIGWRCAWQWAGVAPRIAPARACNRRATARGVRLLRPSSRSRAADEHCCTLLLSLFRVTDPQGEARVGLRESDPETPARAHLELSSATHSKHLSR